MIVMKSRREVFNFYESFSDLIFNTLVLFLFLILCLVVNVNKRVESVAKSEVIVAMRLRDSETRIEELRKDEVALVDRRAALDKEADALKVAVQRQQRRVQDLDREIEKKHEDLQQTIQEQDMKIAEAKNRINDLEGTNRFTGGIGRCRVFVAIDVSSTPEKFYVVPATLMEEDRLEFIDSIDDTDGIRRKNTRLFNSFLAAAKESGGLSQEQLSTLVAQTSLFWQFGTGAKLGIRMERRKDGDGVVVRGLMVQGGPFKQAGGRAGDIIVSADEMTISDMEDLFGFLRSPGGIGSTFKLGVLRGGTRMELTVLRQFAGPWQMEEILHPRFSNELSLARDSSQSADSVAAKVQLAFDRLASDPVNLEIKSHPTLTLRIPETSRPLSISPTIAVSSKQLTMYLRGSIGTRIAIDVVLPDGISKIPEWFKEDVMIPTGFVTRVPEVPFFGQDSK